MPWNIRFIGKFGNAVLALFSLLIAVVGFEDNPWIALLFAGFAVLGAFNVYVLSKAARVIAEDEAIVTAVQQNHPCGGVLDSKPKASSD